MGSTRKVIEIGETITNTSYTPPSPIKATLTSITSNSDDVSTASVSEAGDIMMTSSSQKGKLLNSLTAIGGPDCQLFFELRARVVFPRIFVRSQSLIAR